MHRERLLRSVEVTHVVATSRRWEPASVPRVPGEHALAFQSGSMPQKQTGIPLLLYLQPSLVP